MNRNLNFCPHCGNMLTPDQGTHCIQFVCPTCPYVWNIVKTISHVTRPKQKELGDIIDSNASWDGPKTQKKCEKCDSEEAYFTLMQIRSADEPMTEFYRCCNPNCATVWREDN